MVAPPQIIQEFHGKTPISIGKSCKRIIGLQRLDPIKKGPPDNPFCTIFFRRPKVGTDKKLLGPSPTLDGTN